MGDWSGRLVDWSHRVNWLVERLCAVLVATMVAIVWFGVLSRYVLELGVTWTEELSRYVMIWAALLAISCGAYRREHIGLELLVLKLPPRWKTGLKLALDLVGLAFFLFLTLFGISMTQQGASQYATIFGMTMLVPFASVPVAAALTSFQLLVSIRRDLSGDHGVEPQVLDHGGAA